MTSTKLNVDADQCYEQLLSMVVKEKPDSYLCVTSHDHKCDMKIAFVASELETIKMLALLITHLAHEFPGNFHQIITCACDLVEQKTFEPETGSLQ